MGRHAVILSMIALAGLAGPASADYRPYFVSSTQSPLVSMGHVEQVGEIIVMEGDAEIVTDLGDGTLSISGDNLNAIIERFYLWYPDEFDALTVTTTFADPTNGGAYAICGEPRVTGLGSGGGGCPGGSNRLLSVTNMNSTDTWGDAAWGAVMGQEFGHSWLVSWMFNDPETGAPSSEGFLGRDGSHYASWVQAEGSYMDGVEWIDNGDGTFTAKDSMVRFSSLDLYAMGIIPPEEVKPFFIIRGATTLAGEPLAADEGVPNGTIVTGTRVDITIDDIMAASGGARMPAWDDEPEEFRQAFILVTAPGVSAAEVAADIETYDARRLAWEERFAADTGGRGFVCTDVTARCPRAAARVVSVTVKEKSPEGNGVLEPGEDLIAVVELWNTGGADATTAMGVLRAEGIGFDLEEPAELPVIPVNEKKTVEIPFRITGDACGQELKLTAVATIEQRHWKASTTLRPGISEGVMETFATTGGWHGVDPADTATTGRWQHGVPGPLYFAGRLLQPEGGHGGKTDAAWFTSIEGRWDTSELAGGATYLTSDVMDLSTTLSPTLVFHVWYLALDRPALTPSATAHLVVQVSSDDGGTWRDIHEVSGGALRWQRVEVPVPDDVELTATMRFRFMAADDADAASRLVEVGIDDLQVNGHVASCKDEDGGCGCRVGGRGGAPGWPAGLLLAALGAVTALRRRSSRSPRR